MGGNHLGIIGWVPGQWVGLLVGWLVGWLGGCQHLLLGSICSGLRGVLAVNWLAGWLVGYLGDCVGCFLPCGLCYVVGCFVGSFILIVVCKCSMRWWLHYTMGVLVGHWLVGISDGMVGSVVSSGLSIVDVELVGLLPVSLLARSVGCLVVVLVGWFLR